MEYSRWFIQYILNIIHGDDQVSSFTDFNRQFSISSHPGTSRRQICLCNNF